MSLGCTRKPNSFRATTRPPSSLVPTSSPIWQAVMPPRAVDAVGHVYRPLDDERIIVEGRVRIRRPQGGFADRPMVWALIFRGGLLYRSWAVGDVTHAELLVTQPQVSND